MRGTFPLTDVRLNSILPCAALLAILGLPGCNALAGWLAPGDRLWFPERPLFVDVLGGRHYDTDGDGDEDFAFLPASNGSGRRLDRLCYDDDRDGSFDREVSISGHDPHAVPHLIVLLDSIPYRLVKARFDAGDFNWFHEPVKVVPPFPSMSVVIFACILRAESMPAVVERYLDPEENELVNLLIEHLFGHELAWCKLLDWHESGSLGRGVAFLAPEPWLTNALYETARTARLGVEAAQPVIVTYVGASSGMACARGREGLERCIDLIEPLCLQILHETEGAITISVLSDHGHNLTPSVRFDAEGILDDAGFEPTQGSIDFDREVFVELDGLVSYFGVQTGRPREVAEVLLARPEVEMVFLRDRPDTPGEYDREGAGSRVLVRDALGTACIERRGDRVRYEALDRDVLGYAGVVAALRVQGLFDEDGFATDRDWLLASIDHAYPDAPPRLIDAFDRGVRYPCPVLCILRDGHHAGLESFEPLLDMVSTHGGLAQFHSDAMLLTMVPGVTGPLRSRDVLRAIEPRYDPAARSASR